MQFNQRCLSVATVLAIAVAFSASPLIAAPAKPAKGTKNAAAWSCEDLGSKEWHRDKTGPADGTYHVLAITVTDPKSHAAFQRAIMLDGQGQVVGDVEYPTDKLTDPAQSPDDPAPLTQLLRDTARGKFAPQKFKAPAAPKP